jgi:glutamine synthetase
MKELLIKIKNQSLVRKALTRINANLTTAIAGDILMGAELEFYFLGDIKKFSNLLMHTELFDKICLRGIEAEKGLNQYEIRFAVCQNAVTLAQHIIIAKEILANTATKLGFEVDFSAKPFRDQPGSALHLHLSLQSQGVNLFIGEDNKESLLFNMAVAGLCKIMPASMIFFAHQAKDFARFVPYANAPVNVSWGGNNRTVSLRIPCNINKRIEHRLACANADPYYAILAFLIGVDYGIRNKLNLREKKIYGRAYDKCYNLVSLPNNIFSAARKFKQEQIMQEYLKALIGE